MNICWIVDFEMISFSELFIPSDLKCGDFTVKSAWRSCFDNYFVGDE